jgi:hypothetical protein
MKTMMLLAAWTFAAIGGYSQTVLNQGNMTPQVPNHYRFIRTSYAAPGPDGSGVSHQFATATGFDSTYMFIGNAQDAPSADSFPGATHTFLQTPDSVYDFIQVDAHGFHNVGQLFSNPPGIYPQDDPKTILPFPMHFGASAVDSFSSVNQQALFTVFSRGTTSFEGKADGQLTTPFGTYSDVLKVHTVRVSRDSIVDSVGAFISTVTTTSDLYYTPGLPFPIVASIVQDAGFFQDSFSIFMIEGTVDLPEPKGFSFSLHPNPSSDQVHVRMEGAAGKLARFDLLDLHGRCVMGGEGRMDTAGEWTISLADVPVGIYLLRMACGGRWMTEKLVRE